MEIDPKVLQDLAESHDELIKVCQAAFEVIFPNKYNNKKMTQKLKLKGIKEGFTTRAEEARRKVSRLLCLEIAKGTDHGSSIN